MAEPALMLRRSPGHASFVGEPDTEGLRRLRCAIAAGPALRQLRADEEEQRALDAADSADREREEQLEDDRDLAHSYGREAPQVSDNEAWSLFDRR